jgi:hypothetical protein
MKNISGHTGTLQIIKRLPSSINGNPRFLVQVAGFTCRTEVDSALGYEIQNMDGRQVIATIGTHYGVATLNSVSAIKL